MNNKEKFVYSTSYDKTKESEGFMKINAVLNGAEKEFVYKNYFAIGWEQDDSMEEGQMKAMCHADGVNSAHALCAISLAMDFLQETLKSCPDPHTLVLVYDSIRNDIFKKISEVDSNIAEMFQHRLSDSITQTLKKKMQDLENQ